MSLLTPFRVISITLGLSISILLLTFNKVLASDAAVFHHDLGQVTLNKTPERIAVLDWTHAEMLLTLGIVPVGVTHISGYRKWQSNNPELPVDQVTELGFRASPNLQTLRDLKPDLIIGYRFRHQRIYQQLTAIAPTMIFNQYPHQDDQADYPERMRRVFLLIADAVNKRPLAEALLIRMDQNIDNARKQIAQAGLTGQAVAFSKFVGMGLGLRIYNDSSLAGSTINNLGLVNHWQHAIEGRDFSHLPLSQLYRLNDARLIHVGDLNVEGRAMTESPVWPLLTFVKTHRLYQSEPLWSFGGPVSAERMAENIARILTQSVPPDSPSTTASHQDNTDKGAF